MFLTEDKLSSLLVSCQQSGDFSSLKQNLWDVFSSPDCLGGSWLLSSTTAALPSNTATVCQAGAPRRTKEELRALEGEKDVDSCEEEKPVEKVAENASAVCTVDIPGLRRSFEKLFSLDNSIFEAGLVNALVMLCSNLEMDLKVKPNVAKDVNFLNLYEIVFELPVIGYEAYLENVLPLVIYFILIILLFYMYNSGLSGGGTAASGESGCPGQVLVLTIPGQVKVNAGKPPADPQSEGLHGDVHPGSPHERRRDNRGGRQRHQDHLLRQPAGRGRVQAARLGHCGAADHGHRHLLLHRDGGQRQ